MTNFYFDWDEHNLAHIAAHNVTPEEAEQVLLGSPLELDFDADVNNEERWTYVGETNTSRILRVVVTMRQDRLRVVTAFEPARQTRLAYLALKGKNL